MLSCQFVIFDLRQLWRIKGKENAVSPTVKEENKINGAVQSAPHQTVMQLKYKNTSNQQGPPLKIVLYSNVIMNVIGEDSRTAGWCTKQQC